ncbi:MAG: TonB-dependent receptor [Spirosomaceae bacterium]|jgi:hypothetical protein|nr:TonB-dependent receptor [Spirosomataceae bacterium]
MPYSKILIFLVISTSLLAQSPRTGVVTGKVIDKNTQEALVGAGVQIENTQVGTTTDVEGRFKLTVPVGSVNLKATIVGYIALTKYNIVVTSGNAQTLTFELEEENKTLGEVVVKSNRVTAAATTLETPNSIQRLTTEEIRSNPGGNFDISRVIQSLPGVGGTSGSVGGFRNDIIIRGGAPNENVYYIDGIEIPVINHFTTQGAAGGPTGILNVSFIEDVTLSSSSFDARYDNALASVFQFKQREGNRERFQGNVRLSASELAGTFEGPLSKKTNYMLSARRSYLQLLFEAIDLPIRPNYWDFQYKVTHRINPKTTLTAIGVGAIDEFAFGVPRQSTPENTYILRSVPSIQQWNYTTGFAIKRLIENGYVNIALSRNMFENRLDRFENQEKIEAKRILGSESQEIENKLRVDVNKFINGWKFAWGGVAQYVKYNNDFNARIRSEIRNAQGVLIQPELRTRFNTAVDFFRLGAFGQISKGFLDNKLNLSAGVRTDMNTFTNDGMNPLRTLSPRVALSYSLDEKWSLNASVGRYFKLPIYTVLGYKNEAGQFANKDNKYINSNHFVLGTEFLPKSTMRFTLEGFYKNYNDYPVSVRDGVSLANQGGDFGAIGNERTSSVGQGRAFGFEFLFQQKLTKKTFAVFSYTFVRSEFSGLNGTLIPSAWDNRHLVSALWGQKLGRNWELGIRYRFAGGAPFTPFDLDASRRNYLTLGTGVLDFNRLNAERLGAFNQLDIRIDKKWNYRRWTLDLFLDLINAVPTESPAFPRYTFQQSADGAGFATTDGQAVRLDGSNAIPFILPNDRGTPIPTLGFIVEF